jgi:HAD superfamily hydrolase (TIGR01549 family)|tara:strand:- start:504 stop:1238 length:735 start_codon:yes stop_codon:yes gene_type:complete
VIKHICFDKDGIIIDVHSYWHYNCQLRAEHLINNLQLDPSLIGQLLWAMGIDAKSGQIKEEGPVGYHPRDIVINSAVEFLADLNEKVTFSDISTMFMEVDSIQQAKDDYNIQLLKGVNSFLQWLEEKKILTSIYTSDRRLNAEKILDKVGLGDFFDTVVGGDDVTKGKPDPEGFLAACNEVHVHPDHSAYVGDTISDMVMGKNGGAAMVVGLETGLFASSELQKETKYSYPSMIEFNAEIQQFL